MLRRPPKSTLFPTRRSSDLYPLQIRIGRRIENRQRVPRAQQDALRYVSLHVGEETRIASHPPHDEPSFLDRKSTRLNSSHQITSYAVFCLKKKNFKSSLHRL